MSRKEPKRKGQAVSPSRVWASLEYVQNVLIPTIQKEYREAHDYRFGRRDRHTDHVDEKNRGQERVATFNTSDTTGNVAVDQTWISNRLASIGADILDAEKTFRSLRGRLGKLFEDPQEEYGPMRRDPIPDSKQTADKKRGEAFQTKRHIQEEIDRHKMEAARLERLLKEAG